jgi:hypothetical protein
MVLERILQFSHATLDLLPWRVRHTWQLRNQPSRRAGFARLHQTPSSERRYSLFGRQTAGCRGHDDRGVRGSSGTMSSLRTCSRSPDWLNVFSWSSRRLVPSLLLGPHLPTDVANLLSSAFAGNGIPPRRDRGLKVGSGREKSPRGPNRLRQSCDAECGSGKRKFATRDKGAETSSQIQLPLCRDGAPTQNAAESGPFASCGTVRTTRVRALIDREKAKRQNARSMPLAVSAPLIGKFSALTS